MIEKNEEKNSYEKIVDYFGFGTSYSKKEVIDGLVDLGLAPKGKGLVSKFFQNVSLNSTRSKQLGEDVLVLKFMKRNRHSNSYELIGYKNSF